MTSEPAKLSVIDGKYYVINTATGSKREITKQLYTDLLELSKTLEKKDKK